MVAYPAIKPRRFKNRLEEIRAINEAKGWDPMTPEERKAFDEAIRMVTNLD